ncbi:MAG: hypothetical protein CVV42_07755 [Candidatus Riflebacteria bacterium HGW-Riflebacteria-2]|jgi:hypothetical protein|nr:MAG: hypothetical protein CVV42_07755 [Candidatus Riflebacteria bacterium HGW-Riflebacteria-2]
MMQPQQIKNAFAGIAREAASDELLSRAIASRVSAEKSLVPVNQLKALFWQFLAVILPAIILYFALAGVQVDIVVVSPDIDMLVEQGPLIAWNNTDALANTALMTMWFIRGALRGFILLAVLTFILTAAAMPVRRYDENTGGSPCVA